VSKQRRLQPRNELEVAFVRLLLDGRDIYVAPGPRRWKSRMAVRGQSLLPSSLRLTDDEGFEVFGKGLLQPLVMRGVIRKVPGTGRFQKWALTPAAMKAMKDAGAE
jgi:hypothetical protein